MMKGWLLSMVLSLNSAWALGIKGKVLVDSACHAGKVMVWLSKNAQDFAKKELLLHTAVPERGTFEFSVLPGEYLVVASNEKGCAVERVVQISKEDILLSLQLVEAKP